MLLLLKNNTEVTNRINKYRNAVMLLLLPRFCANFSLQTLKIFNKYLAPPEIFSPPGCVGLATALL